MKRIARERDAGHDVYVPNGGADRWRLVKAFIDENIDQARMIRERDRRHVLAVDRNGVKAEAEALAFMNPKRLVLRVESDGGRYILKRAFMGSPGFKRLFPGVPGLTYFTRIMKRVNAAVRAGCDATQEYHLVAERWVSPFRLEVWALMRYLEGDQLRSLEAFVPHRGELDRTARELLRHGLTMDDLSVGNFIVDGSSVRAIDISCRPFIRLQKVKMALKLNALYGLSLPVEGVVDRALAGMLSLRYRLRGGME